jgi:FKBP-type peptidyl-prolyl cis-trans isomerase
VVNIYSTKEAADSAFRAQSELARQKDSLKAIEQIKKDDKAITDYLKKNNIQATKAPAGTYVEIITPGAGNAFDSTTVVKVNYTGKLLDGGKVFDSNVDPQFSHQKPFNVNLGIPSGQPGSVIKGWIDGFSLLKKGAKARFYIPSSLAYGAQGAGADIKANSNLLFDVEVLDVITAAQAKIEEEKEKKEMEAMQQKAMDSMMKAQSKDTVQKAK